MSDEALRIRGIHDLAVRQEKKEQGLDLFKITETEYGGRYKDHLLEQYKLYLGIVENFTARRSTTNTFFLTANTLFLSGLGVLSATRSGLITSSLLAPVIWSVAGILLCLSWRSTVRSYQQLNAGRFKIIHAIENKLPLAIFEAEWKALGEGKDPKIYKPLTSVESGVPLIFAALYALLCITIILASFVLN